MREKRENIILLFLVFLGFVLGWTLVLEPKTFSQYTCTTCVEKKVRKSRVAPNTKTKKNKYLSEEELEYLFSTFNFDLKDLLNEEE